MVSYFKKLACSCAFLIALHPSGWVGAQVLPNKKTWTLQDCLEFGLNHSLQVKQSLLNGDIARLNLNQARNSQLPSVNGSSSYGYNFGLNNDPTTGILVKQNTRSNGISLSTGVPLFNGFQLRNTVKQNKLNLEATEQDIEKSKNDIILNIVSAYLQVLLSDELLLTAQLQLTNSKNQADRTQKLFKAGSVAESNVFEINAQIASDEVTIVNAQNQKDLAELNLMQLLNILPDPDFEVVKPAVPNPTGELIGFDPENIYESAQARMPEIRSSDLRVKSALVGIDISKGNYLPQLSLGGSYSTNYFNLNKVRLVGYENNTVRILETVGFLNNDRNQPVIRETERQIPIIENYNYFTQLFDNRGGGVYLNLNIPVFNGFRARNSVNRSVINHKNAILSTEIARNQLRQAIQQAYADATAAQKRFAATQRQLAALELTFTNAQIRFNNGVLNATDFSVARNNFNRAQSDLIQAKYQYTFRLKILEFYQGKSIAL